MFQSAICWYFHYLHIAISEQREVSVCFSAGNTSNPKDSQQLFLVFFFYIIKVLYCIYIPEHLIVIVTTWQINTSSFQN